MTISRKARPKTLTIRLTEDLPLQEEPVMTKSLPSDPELLVVRVTQDDIDQGIKRNGLYCPLARAASRKLGLDVPQVYTSGSFTTVPGGATLLAYYHSRRAKQFILAFDQGRAVKPSTFYFRYWTYRNKKELF